jgi:hypothetical protein
MALGKKGTRVSIYFNSSESVIVTTTPKVEFNQKVPNWFINQFIKYMSKGLIRVTDYQGNELKVYYDAR